MWCLGKEAGKGDRNLNPKVAVIAQLLSLQLILSMVCRTIISLEIRGRPVVLQEDSEPA